MEGIGTDEHHIHELMQRADAADGAHPKIGYDNAAKVAKSATEPRQHVEGTGCADGFCFTIGVLSAGAAGENDLSRLRTTAKHRKITG